LIQHNGQWTCESDDAGNPDEPLDAMANEVFVAPHVEEGFVGSSMVICFWLQATGSFGIVETVKRYSRCTRRDTRCTARNVAEESFREF